MSNWTKRRAAGVIRNLFIGIMIAVLIIVLYLTGILEIWLSDIDWGVGMFFQEQFYFFLVVMIMLVGLITFCIRSNVNWGGA